MAEDQTETEVHPAVALDAHLAGVVQSASKRKSLVQSIEAYIKHVIAEVEGLKNVEENSDEQPR